MTFEYTAEHLPLHFPYPSFPIHFEAYTESLEQPLNPVNLKVEKKNKVHYKRSSWERQMGDSYPI